MGSDESQEKTERAPVVIREPSIAELARQHRDRVLDAYGTGEGAYVVRWASWVAMSRH